MERGRQIGADVPYCVDAGGGRRWRRDRRDPDALAAGSTGICFGGKPGVNVSTKFVYGRLDAANLKEHPDIDGMVARWDKKICVRWRISWATYWRL